MVGSIYERNPIRTKNFPFFQRDSHFTDDTVISEPFGSGGYGVALYELTMKEGDAPVESGLKYSRIVTADSKEPATVRVRYKEPLADTSHEVEYVIETADASFTDDLRLAFIVYVCAEKLRGSERISDTEIGIAKKLYAELGDAARERNAADLYKLAGILDKTESELGVGIDEDEFLW
jgi:Ca-activated chloride channel family protein